jgi:hypothetical protein
MTPQDVLDPERPVVVSLGPLHGPVRTLASLYHETLADTVRRAVLRLVVELRDEIAKAEREAEPQ